VFLNSHLLSEIEITCDRVAFIKDGEVIADRDLRTSSTEGYHVTAQVGNLPPSALAQLAPLVQSPRYEGEQLTFGVSSEDVLPRIVRLLAASGADVYRVTPEALSLEDLFVKLVGEDRGL
jgi:ABC-2 type transport system ATP-binding protein